MRPGGIRAFRSGRGRYAAPLLLFLALLVVACGGGSDTPREQLRADAGPDITVVAGRTVQLDGTASRGPAGAALTYSWRFTSTPAGSGAVLVDPGTARPTFLPDLAGEYAVTLTVAHGNREASASVTVTVAPAGSEPVARPGADRTVLVGSEVQLDGRASTDPSGAPLTYLWEFTERPDDSVASLDNPNGKTPRFTADRPGNYVLLLTVDNGTLQGSAKVTITGGRPPTANAGADVEEKVGNEVTLDGSASSDPDGDSLTFTWSILSHPTGSSASLAGADTATPQFTPDVSGEYLVELSVSDGTFHGSDRVVVTAVPASGRVSGTLYVSPSGSDANAGSEAEPLATVGAALSIANLDAGVSRIRLAPGDYDAEPFGYRILKSIQLIGPGGSTEPARLSATNDLFSVGSESARGVTALFSNLALETTGTAIRGENGAVLNLTSVNCSATTCVESVGKLMTSAGRVHIRDSHLLSAGTGTGTGTGVSASITSEVQVIGGTVDNFATGIHAGLLTRILVRDTRLQGNATGVRVGNGPGGLITNARILGGAVGIESIGRSKLEVNATEVEGGSAALRVDRGSEVHLSDVTARGDGTGTGLVLGASNSTGEYVRVRGSTISGGDLGGRAVLVAGAASSLDLGTSEEAGNNELSGGGLATLYDQRPSNASGIVSLRATRVAGAIPTPGVLTGPRLGNTPLGIKIENSNSVYIH